MEKKEFLFDELTARDVAERLRVRAEIDAYLNAVALTVARVNGCAPTDRVMLNAAGTGVVFASPPDPLSHREGETETPHEAEPAEKAERRGK